MDKNQIAEDLLGTVLDADAATAAAGDLLEQASGARFWGLLLITWSGLLWRQAWLDAPRVLLASVVGAGFFYISTAAATLFVFLAALLTGFLFKPGGLGAAVYGSFWFYELTSAFIALFSAWVAGKWAARRAPRNELAAALTAIPMCQIMGALLFVAFTPFEDLPAAPYQRPFSFYFHVSHWDVAGWLVMLAAAYWVRRRRARALAAG